MNGTETLAAAQSVEHELAFEAMGTRIRLLVGARLTASLPPAPDAALRERRRLSEFESRLSRFLPDSELSAMNRDPRSEIPVSPLLGAAVTAGLRAARLSGGLCDPTLLSEVERAGYRQSRTGVEPASLEEALAAAPRRRAARPRNDERWGQISFDPQAGVVRRPQSLGFDTGGVGKGLAADLVAKNLHGYERFVVDCGGDLRIGGPGALLRPYEVQVAHPLSREPFHTLKVCAGGVATSGLDRRRWRVGEVYGHHLIDPYSGQPAWTGLISATALAPTAVDAEALATAAILAGPSGAQELLSKHGGVLVHEGGESTVIESAAGLAAKGNRSGKEDT